MDDLKFGDVLVWRDNLPPDRRFMYIGPASTDYLGGAEIGQLLVIVGYEGSPTGSLNDRYLEYFKKAADDA